MCYPCRHCGQCELKRPRPFGVCPLCGNDNGFDAVACTSCGFAFPPRAGEGGGCRPSGDGGAKTGRRAPAASFRLSSEI